MHLDRDVLLRFRDSGDGDRSRVLSHLAECGACAAEYAELVRRQPPNEAPAEDGALDAEAFSRVGRAIGPGGTISSQTKWRQTRWWFGVAAAAVVAVGLLSPRFIETFRTPPDGTPVVRGATLEPIAPGGVVGPSFSFRWESRGDDVTYLVEVFDARRELVLARETNAPELVHQSDAGSPLRPGATYFWMVSALDSRGEPVLTSPLTTFRIEPSR